MRVSESAEPTIPEKRKNRHIGIWGVRNRTHIPINNPNYIHIVVKQQIRFIQIKVRQHRVGLVIFCFRVTFGL